MAFEQCQSHSLFGESKCGCVKVKLNIMRIKRCIGVYVIMHRGTQEKGTCRDQVDNSLHILY